MDKIQKLEDLKVWQEALKLAKLVYALTAELPREEDYNIKKHMHECARSVPANIAEGFGRYYYEDSIQFCRISLGSLNEMKSDLYLSHTLAYVPQQDFDDTIHQIEKVDLMLKGLIKSASLIKPPA